MNFMDTPVLDIENSALRAEDLSKVVTSPEGMLTILDQVGLQVSHGERIAIIGASGAGKSTLLNQLTQSRVLAENKLFATLDPSSRRLRLPRDNEVIITDTVGFIRDLPKELMAAFKATLEELENAFRFNDAVLRHLVISRDKAITEASPMAVAVAEEKAKEKEAQQRRDRRVERMFHPHREPAACPLQIR